MELYFKGTVSGEETLWTDTGTGYGNWFTDHAFLGGAHTTVPATRAPEAGDDVVILTTFSDDPLYIYHTIVLGNTSPVASPYFDMGQNLRATAGITLRGASFADNVTLTGNVTLYDSSAVGYGDVIGSVTCHDGSALRSDINTPTGAVTFNDDSCYYGMANLAAATFNDRSYSAGSGIIAAATFTGTAYNINTSFSPPAGGSGVTFTNDVVFTGGVYYDDSTWTFQGTCTYILNSGDDNSGTIRGNATFNDGSTCSGTVAGNATFKDGSTWSGAISTTGNATFESGSIVVGYGIDGTAVMELGADIEGWSNPVFAATADVTCYAVFSVAPYGLQMDGNITFYNLMNYNGMVGLGATAHFTLRGFSFGAFSGTFGSVTVYDTSEISTSYVGPVTADITMYGESHIYGGTEITGDVTLYDNSRPWYSDVDNDGVTIDGALTVYGAERTANPIGYSTTASGGITFPNPVVFNMTGPVAEWGTMGAIQAATFLDTVEWKISTFSAVQNVVESYFSVNSMPSFVIKLPALDVLGTGLL